MRKWKLYYILAPWTLGAPLIYLRCRWLGDFVGGMLWAKVDFSEVHSFQMTYGKKQWISVQKVLLTKCHTVVCLVWGQIQRSRIANRYLNGGHPEVSDQICLQSSKPKIGKRVAWFFKNRKLFTVEPRLLDLPWETSFQRSCTTNSQICL